MDEIVKDDGGKGQEEAKEEAKSPEVSKDDSVAVGAVEDKKSEEKVDVDAEYEQLRKEAEEGRQAKAKLAEFSNTQVEVEKTKNELVSKVVSALGIGEPKKEEDELALIDDEEKLYKHLQKTGYKGLVGMMRKVANKDAQGIVSSILSQLSANATLYSEYPELKDEKSELSVEVDSILKKHQMPKSIQTQKFAAEMAKLKLGAMKVATDVAGAVDDAKKGIEKKADETHVEISKKGIPSKKAVSLNDTQKQAAKAFKLSEADYVKAREAVSLDDYIKAHNKGGK